MNPSIDRTEAVKQLFVSTDTLYRRWRSSFFKVVANEEISPVQISILVALLYGKGRMSGRNLCEALSMSPSALSQQLDSLNSMGYLTKETDTNDRRITYFGMTDAGRELAEMLESKRMEFFKEVTASLSDREMAAIMAIQEKMTRYLTDHK